MKAQFVFASFLVCSLQGELFGEVVEDSDNADLEPETRAFTYDSGCVKNPDRNGIVYSRTWYPRTHSTFSGQKSSMAYRNVQFPRYREDSYINLPNDGSINFGNVPGGYSVNLGVIYPGHTRFTAGIGSTFSRHQITSVDSADYHYPGQSIRYSLHKNGPLGSYGKGPRNLYKAVKNFVIDGKYIGKMPLNSEGKRSGIVYLNYLLRDKNARQVLRRMLNTDDAEEEDKMEDVQDY